VDETDGKDLRRKELIKINTSQTIGDVLSAHVDEKCCDLWVSKDDTKRKEEGTVVSDFTTPIHVIVNVFKCFCRQKSKQGKEQCENLPDAFDFLMNARKKYDKFPDERYVVVGKISLSMSSKN
jgi:hypothetical protein